MPWRKQRGTRPLHAKQMAAKKQRLGPSEPRVRRRPASGPPPIRERFVIDVLSGEDSWCSFTGSAARGEQILADDLAMAEGAHSPTMPIPSHATLRVALGGTSVELRDVNLPTQDLSATDPEPPTSLWRQVGDLTPSGFRVQIEFLRLDVADLRYKDQHHRPYLYYLHQVYVTTGDTQPQERVLPRRGMVAGGGEFCVGLCSAKLCSAV